MSNAAQITGNIGLYHVARELSRVGWNVMPTVRNAKGADLYVSSEDERTILPIQVKTHSGKPQDLSLSLHPERLVTKWWIFVAYALTQNITCYLLTLDEIRERMRRDSGARTQKPESQRQFWLDRRFYTPGSDREMVEARDAWDRLGRPR
jgi:hypothetical protein